MIMNPVVTQDNQSALNVLLLCNWPLFNATTIQKHIDVFFKFLVVRVMQEFITINTVHGMSEYRIYICIVVIRKILIRNEHRIKKHDHVIQFFTQRDFRCMGKNIGIGDISVDDRSIDIH